MSFYHMINGVKPATFFILPMLGKHPDEYPRFRDCFLGDQDHPQYDDHIHVYTRTGGGNRESYKDEIAEMRAMPEYVTDWDDSFDCTYASWVFRVPDRWKEDFVRIKEGNLHAISDEYRAELYRVFPKLREKFNQIFSENATKV